MYAFKYRPLSPEVKARVIELMEKGRVLQDICDDLGLRRMALHEETIRDPFFKKQIDDLREMHTEDLVDSLPTIADNCETMVQAACARIKSDNIKTVAGWRNPRKYGKQMDINVNYIDLSAVLTAAEGRITSLAEAKQAVIDVRNETVAENPVLQSLQSKPVPLLDPEIEKETVDAVGVGDSDDDDFGSLL